MGKKNEKPRVFSPAFKERAVQRMKAGANVSELATELKVRRKLLYDWRKVLESGTVLRPRGRPRRPPAGPDSPNLQQRVTGLESLVAQLTLENRFFKGALQNIKRLRRTESNAGKPASSPRSKR
jgi:transposase-like protein